MKIKSVLIEDEAQSREILRNYIQKYCKDVDVIGEAADITEAVEVIKACQPDLLFLDVEMPFFYFFDYFYG